MTMPPEYVVDRWRLTRRVTFWRRIAFGALILGVLIAGWRVYSNANIGHLTPHIARLRIEGVIVGDEETLKTIRDVAKSRASGVILSIESPGGTTTGAEKLYDELRRLAEKKPTVAVVGTMAASGGYIAAIGADEIIARGNSLVGSIGVLFEIPNVSQLLDKVGVKVETVKSAPLKAAPNGFEPTSDAAKEALAALVADSFAWFKDLVKDRRHLSDAELTAVTDGRVFTGRQGINLKLVDAIGGDREAVTWLESKGVAKDLPIRDWKRPRSIEGLGILGSASDIASALGLGGVSTLLTHLDAAAHGLILDGLVSIWQGP
jgi:protease-4